MDLVANRSTARRRSTVVATVALCIVRAGTPAPLLGADAEILRLDEVLAEARTRNPAILAARERARAAAALPRQVSAYDDPVLAYEAFNIPESLRLDRAENNIFRISQKIPFPGKRTLAGTVAEHDAAMADREADGSELDVIAEVTRAYYDLWQAHQNLLVYAREKTLALHSRSARELIPH